jgi:hypothetical protein
VNRGTSCAGRQSVRAALARQPGIYALAWDEDRLCDEPKPEPELSDPLRHRPDSAAHQTQQGRGSEPRPLPPRRRLNGRDCSPTETELSDSITDSCAQLQSQWPVRQCPSSVTINAATPPCRMTLCWWLIQVGVGRSRSGTWPCLGPSSEGLRPTITTELGRET